MSTVGRRPTLYELLEALHAIESIEADFAALDPQSRTFRVILVFQRAQCPQDWRDGHPKPSWLFDQIMEELSAWLQQRNREAQWVSKEEQMGSSIDTLMAHYTEELKKAAAAAPQTVFTRLQKRVFTDTILRLKELKERREAGGVYSATESRREKARKAWQEEEFEGPKREEAQQRAHAKTNPGFGDGFAETIFKTCNEHFRNTYKDAFDRMFEDTLYGRDWNKANPPPPPTSGNKRPWHEILGVKAGASKADIQKAYRRLAAKFHPDRYKELDAASRMTEINTARDEGLGGL
jgi:DnaJ-domain-containing protein 1